MICRICLIESKVSLNIYENSSTLIVDIVHQHLQLRPQPDDPLSNIICTKCWNRVDNFHSYYLEVQEAQKNYEKLLVEQVKRSDNESDDSIDCLGFEPSTKVESVEEITVENGIIKSEEQTNLRKTDSLNVDEDDETRSDGNESSFQDGEDISRNENRKEDEWKRRSSVESGDEYDCITDSENAKRSRNRLDDDARSGEIDGTSDENESSFEDSEDSSSENENETKEEWKPPSSDESGDEFEYISDSENIKRPGNKLEEIDKEIAKHIKLACHLCSKQFTKYAHLSHHYRTVHNVRTCYIYCCDAKHVTRPLILDHVRWHLDPNYFRCKECNKSLVNRARLKLHMEMVHTPQEAKLYKCDQCPSAFTRKHFMERHIEIHSKERNFPCEQCKKSFRNEKILRRHQLTIHEKSESSVCDVCAKVLSSKLGMRLHRRIHQDDPMIPCKECGKFYKSECHLKKHMRIHDPNDTEPCKCDVCGKVSSSRRALKKHRRAMHEYKLRYTCKVCNTEFRRLLNLKEHMATHTGEQLYTCQHCPKTFNSKSNIHTHTKKTHPKEFEEAKKRRELSQRNSKSRRED